MCANFPLVVDISEVVVEHVVEEAKEVRQLKLV